MTALIQPNLIFGLRFILHDTLLCCIICTNIIGSSWYVILPNRSSVMLIQNSVGSLL